MRKYSKHYGPGSNEQSANSLIPLPRALCRLLYVFCKVRGVKVISRFFNNEARYLESMVTAFIDWDGDRTIENGHTIVTAKCLTWEERYVMLMWLSHLLLAPFDLQSISSDEVPEAATAELELPLLPPDLPSITKSLLSLSFKYLVTPGKERDAASNLLARLTMRPDMQRLGLPTNMVTWALSKFQGKSQEEAPTVFTTIGIMSFVARLLGSGEAQELAVFVPTIFDTFRSVAYNEDQFSTGVRASASSRKLIVKILRTAVVLALSLEDNSISPDVLSTMIEDAIDYFLSSLADQDTPVRFAASKALSVITLKLDSSMGAEVVEAVIGSLSENMLWENPKSGVLIPATEILESERRTMRPNISAVNSLRWQGLMLTLGQLLFRRSPPVHQLPDILMSLLSGLVFEQRLSTGTSVGVGVRDAANFGIWSVSRKYSSKELLALDVTAIQHSETKQYSSCQQLLAVGLVTAACLDPSGNIRRGSSAALQELIGRHPDIILEGIPLVQAVDYHAVARRSRAMLEVAENAAKLGDIYWESILGAILEWRGLGAPDAESRRIAAKAIGRISALHSYEGLERSLKKLVECASGLPSQSVELRHGYFLGLSAVVEAFNGIISSDESDLWNPTLERIANTLHSIWAIFEQFLDPSRKDLHSPALRPELTVESCSRLLDTLSHACSYRSSVSILRLPPDKILESALTVLSLCLSRTEDIAIHTSSLAASSIFVVLDERRKEALVNTWLQNLKSEAKSVGGGGRKGYGHIAALGAIYHLLPQESGLREEVSSALLACTSPDKQLELRISALQSVNRGVLSDLGLCESV
jgi:tubulin-specific chaperone D